MLTWICSSCATLCKCKGNWSLTSVWMQDPVSAGSAVLIKKYNISQQKELELQLGSQQVALQRSAHPASILV
jgi:hypothetical protein